MWRDKQESQHLAHAAPHAGWAHELSTTCAVSTACTLVCLRVGAAGDWEANDARLATPTRVSAHTGEPFARQRPQPFACTREEALTSLCWQTTLLCTQVPTMMQRSSLGTWATNVGAQTPWGVGRQRGKPWHTHGRRRLRANARAARVITFFQRFDHVRADGRKSNARLAAGAQRRRAWRIAVWDRTEGTRLAPAAFVINARSSPGAAVATFPSMAMCRSCPASFAHRCAPPTSITGSASSPPSCVGWRSSSRPAARSWIRLLVQALPASVRCRMAGSSSASHKTQARQNSQRHACTPRIKAGCCVPAMSVPLRAC